MAISLKENMMLALQHKEPEYMPIVSDFDLANPAGLDFVNEHPSVPGVNLDWFGQSWTYEPNIGGANPTPGVHLLSDITKWKEVMKFPTFDKMDWEGKAEQTTAKWDRDRRPSRLTIGYGLWERLFTIMPFTDALTSLVTEPEACYDFFSAMADHKIRLHEYCIKYYKPDLLIMHDDYGNNRSLFMSPEVWRELLKPHLKRVIDHVNSMGVMYEHHCCGHLAPLLEEIADLGATAYNNVHISNNPPELKKRLGHKITFVGGFDTQFIDNPLTTEEQIRPHVREVIDNMAPGGSWIPRAVLKTKSKIEIFNDELLKYGATNYYGPRPA